MEPALISKKTIKKILKKDYFKDDNYLNKYFKNIISKINLIKINWLPILIVIFGIILIINLYFDHKKKKEKELLENDKMLLFDKKENFDDDFKNKPNYESEYYKMLPKITTNPDIIPYKY